VGSFFETTQNEKLELLTLIDKAKQHIEKEFKPHAYNIGINDGAAAGQTVPHLHIHLIPRYEGDVKDPRGGVRWVIADKADYWSKK
jgi:diadenosine tetraphosphate (Ap4A) HIT family hydrolase